MKPISTGRPPPGSGLRPFVQRRPTGPGPSFARPVFGGFASRALRGAGLSAVWILAAAAVPGGALADQRTPGAEGKAAARWTAATPDEMVDHALARAKRGGDDALAALVIAASLDERAAFMRVRDGLSAIAASSSPWADDARWLGLRLAPALPGATWPGARAVSFNAGPDPNGLVRAFAILGPFQDTGGGLMRREGPEGDGQSWSDPTARFAWGVYDVAWRRVLPASASPRGVPLDLYVYPRSESCTYLASKVTVPANPKPMIVHVASAGMVRLVWDGADVAASDDVHTRLLLDRIAARIEPTAGEHLVAVKVCSSAVNDDGRVRVRFTDEQRNPLPLATSSDLRSLKLAAAPQAQAAEPPAAKPKPGAQQAAPAIQKYRVKDAAKPAPAAKDAPAKPAAAAKKPAPAGKKAPLRPAPSDEAPPDDTPKIAAIVPPKGVTVLPTALSRALAIGDSPTPQQALAAAIVRTQGGADNARSPRAPGLLDRVAGAPGITPDELAMTGWISPFGANRSGWLNLALTRARAEHDDATAAFAQRRLVASHLTSRYIDWATSALHEQPLESATDPEALLIKALAKKQLGATGLGRAALDDMLAIDTAQKDKTPISVLQEIADTSRSQRELHLRMARRLAAGRAEARGPSYVQAYRSVDAAAYETAAAEVLAEQNNADAVIRIGRELLDAGRYAWAREVFYVATQLAPNQAAGFHGLAAARQAMAADEARRGRRSTEDPAFARAALARARDLEPGDASLKAELAFRSSGPAGDGAVEQKAQRDEEHIVKPEVFLQKARAKPVKKGDIVDRQVHWVRVVTYHPDKRVSQLMHYSREIVIEPRTENDSYENLPSEGDETELLFAKVHRKDGTVALPEEQSSGGRRPMVRWPELKTGDIVEVAVRAWTSGPVGRRGDAPFYFIDYVGSTDTHPILYNEVVVDSPEASPLAIDVINGKADRVVRTPNGGRVVTRYVWDAPPSVPEEPLAPKLSESLPVVVGSTFGSWNDFREWYRAAVKGFTEPDDQVRRLAAELTKGKTTREDKLKAIFEFVADDIRYVNFVSGEWWLPNRPQELLARRQGDCDDKAMLLITLLKSIGIDATEVLVQTRYTAQPSLLRSANAAIPVFDHGIAYLPGANGKPGTWLDATSPESRLGPVPSMDARTLALFIDEGAAKIVETPASNPDEHGIDAAWTITLSPSGAGDLSADERHSGDAAFELRMNLKQPDARGQWVEAYASNWFPTVQVTGDVQFKPDLPRGVAQLAYAAHSDGLARREGAEIAVPIAEASTLTSQLAPLVKRTLPVVLPPRLAPGHETRNITIIAPPGFTFADLPPNGDVPGGEFGRARLEFSKAAGKKNAVVVKRSVVFDLSTIPVDKYAKWRGWLQRVDGLMHRMVRLVPDDKASAPRVATGAKGRK